MLAQCVPTHPPPPAPTPPALPLRLGARSRAPLHVLPHPSAPHRAYTPALQHRPYLFASMRARTCAPSCPSRIPAHALLRP
eukprot:261679-Chlamydomonas_euryale.AAC.2